MKVERENVKPFVPIVITLETQDEADFMWHRLNHCVSWLDYLRENGVDHLNTHTAPMWEEFSKVYRPK